MALATSGPYPLTVVFPQTWSSHTGDSSAQNPLGIIYKKGGKSYRYVLFNNGQGNVASAAKGCAYWFALDPDGTNGVAPTFTVTSDVTDSLYGYNGCAGIFGAVIPDGYYCWLQVGGECQVAAVTDSGVGDVLIGGSTDLTFSRIAANGTITNVPFAIVKTGSTSGGPTVLLQNLIW